MKLAWSLLLVSSTLCSLRSLCSAQEGLQQADEAIIFFESGVVSEFRLVIDAAGQQRLRDTPREYTRCALEENGAKTFKSIGMKLKGAAGSYRDFDDRPSLTLNIGKYKKGQKFHGMEKFHLNNAVQDESFLSEWLGSELFRQAGVPAPRVGHVRLWINDRDLGLYVLREGFDEPYLKRSFGASDGNLYDGGFIQDIDSELEMDSGADPDNRADLVGLALACYQPEPTIRRSLIADRLDLDQFLTFMAVERLCGHWDGYTLNTNNYRIYFPNNGKAVFLPHGMDQMFGDAGAGLYDHSASLVAAAVMQSDAWRELYRQRLKKLAELLSPVDRLTAKIDALHDRLQPVLESIDPNLAMAHLDRINELKERITQRAEALPELIDKGMPQPIAFDQPQGGNPENSPERGTVRLTDWYPSVEAEEVQVEEVDAVGVASYSVVREQFGDFSSSWRTQVLLPCGRFRFEARVKTEDVIPIPDDLGRGAGIRRSQSGRTNELVGTNGWTPVTYEILVREDQRQVELVLELRARQGKAWFDRESLKIRRLDSK